MRRLATVARRAQRVLVRWAMALTPRSAHLVISGFPVDEGNAVEMLRASAKRYPGPVYWLVPDVEQARAVLGSSRADPHEHIRLVAHRSFSGIRRFVTAEVSMFTHGLYGNPRRVRRKTMVNLWHGGGFKGAVMSDAKGRPAIHSDYLVASTRQFGEILARQCGLPAGGLLLTGNPRIDQFAAASAVGLDRLGIPADRPFVLWMPTFRRNRGRGLTAAWSDVAADEASDVNAVMARGVDVLTREFGVTVVVKPHPQDAESRRIEGALVVTNEHLRDAAVQLYELIGASSALLTDYSSVWIDYLALDRPIGFVVSDEAGYTSGRGFDPPDALDWLPGPKLRTLDDVREFGRDVQGGGIGSSARRREVAEHVGHVSGSGVADRILEELAARGVFSRPLRRAEED
ncbi:CDP-glycerol glycerophosphotransferase family protein [Agromyces sp. NPDC058484]|uniref:CDP-glycerol glycerophosphotransferase family protein n=1 Tax=Agromyces sp. NPDC058484 TaxID=3346524 RepID=UPI0036566EB3